MDNNGLTVNIFDIKTGLRTYKNALYVRIVSSDYNLLIMLDHEPIIGEIKGRVDIKVSDEEYHIENIKASFMNSHNVFNLMIQGDLDDK